MSQIKIKQKRKEFDFALNTNINCEGDISPGLILDTQMPLQVNLDE